MFLPKLMIERWGVPGFLVFAIPNVFGCAAFGYVVKNRTRSEQMVMRHGMPMVWFSVATVAFHIYFITYIFTNIWPILGHELAPLAAAAVMLGLGIVFSFLNNRDWLIMAVLVYALSLTTFGFIGTSSLHSVPWTGAMSINSLLTLLPLVCMGFLLCPYLDLTFHRAVQHAPSRHAFGVFGVTFAVMIVLTVAVWMDAGRVDQRWFGLAVAHVMAQSVFTMGAHLRELRETRTIVEPSHRWLLMLAPLAVAPLLPIARLVHDSPLLGENLYIGFVSLYGGAFPLWFIWQWAHARKEKTPDTVGG